MRFNDYGRIYKATSTQQIRLTLPLTLRLTLPLALISSRLGQDSVREATSNTDHRSALSTGNRLRRRTGGLLKFGTYAIKAGTAKKLVRHSQQWAYVRLRLVTPKGSPFFSYLSHEPRAFQRPRLLFLLSFSPYFLLLPFCLSFFLLPRLSKTPVCASPRGRGKSGVPFFCRILLSFLPLPTSPPARMSTPSIKEDQKEPVSPSASITSFESALTMNAIANADESHSYTESHQSSEHSPKPSIESSRTASSEKPQEEAEIEEQESRSLHSTHQSTRSSRRSSHHSSIHSGRQTPANNDDRSEFEHVIPIEPNSPSNSDEPVLRKAASFAGAGHQDDDEKRLTRMSSRTSGIQSMRKDSSKLLYSNTIER